jgi:hypothetical protein
VNGEKRTTLTILMIAVLSLILAGVFEPRVGVEAKAPQQSEYVPGDLSSWLLRFAAWLPADAPSEPPGCGPDAAQGATSWGLL